MRRSRDASTGSFRARDLELLAPDRPPRPSTRETLQIASREDPRIDRRCDPAYHNRMLFDAANR